MENRSYRSFFWPVLLIGVGLLWLLSNMGYIAPINIGMLFRLWPVLLIVIGLDILFGRRSPLIGTLIGVLAVVFILGVLAFGPALGLYRTPQRTTERLVETLGSARSATVYLDLNEFHTDVRALGNSQDLIDANITHYGNVELRVQQGAEKQVRLVTNEMNRDWFNWDFQPGARWDIGLTGEIPLDLTIDAGSGSTRADLTGLLLSQLNVDVGSGSMDLVLPETDQPYRAMLTGGSGSIDVDVPCGVEIHLDGGSGSQDLNIPAGCAVRVDVQDTGSGSINLRGLEKVQGGSRSDEGIWETQNFSDDGPFTLIVIDDHGSGSLSVR